MPRCFQTFSTDSDFRRCHCYNWPRSQLVWSCVPQYYTCTPSIQVFLQFFSFSYTTSAKYFLKQSSKLFYQHFSTEDFVPNSLIRASYLILPVSLLALPMVLHVGTNILKIWDWLSDSCPTTNNILHFPLLTLCSKISDQWYVRFLRDKGVNSLLEDAHS